MTPSQHERLLAYTAERAKARPEYLASVLSCYAEREKISEEELAHRLGIAASDLPHLALCLRPRADQFIDDVRQISTKFHLDPTTLATVLRLVESFEALVVKNGGEASDDSGLLMAARARKHPPAHQDDERRNHDHPGS
jgi:hypothetical protein